MEAKERPFLSSLCADVRAQQSFIKFVWIRVRKRARWCDCADENRASARFEWEEGVRRRKRGREREREIVKIVGKLSVTGSVVAGGARRLI